MGERFGQLGLEKMDSPMDRFEYDPMRGCKFWHPMTCYVAPSFINKIVQQIPESAAPVLILEVRPFLGAASIALANALSYSGRDGFVLSVDTFRGFEGHVGLLQNIELYQPPAGVAEREPDVMYFDYLRNVAHSIVSPGGYQPAWIPREYRGEKAAKRIANATTQVVPFPLLSSKAKAIGHWFGRKGWRPMLAYVNAPRTGIGDYKLDLEHTWKVLGCGGTMAGDGYRIPEVKSTLAAFVAKHKVLMEAFFVRAAGTRYEQTWQWEDSEAFETKINGFPNTNFTTWQFRGKQCKGADDESLPQLTSSEVVPAEYLF